MIYTCPSVRLLSLVWASAHSCLCAHSEARVLLHHSPFYSFELRPFPEAGAGMLWLSRWSASPSSSPVSACPHGAGIIAIRETMPGMSHGCWDPNSSPYGYQSSTSSH